MDDECFQIKGIVFNWTSKLCFQVYYDLIRASQILTVRKRLYFDLSTLFLDSWHSWYFLFKLFKYEETRDNSSKFKISWNGPLLTE